MTEEHGLSRDQVEALGAALRLWWADMTGMDASPEPLSRMERLMFTDRAGPTVAVMLADAEKRGEDRGRAEENDRIRVAVTQPHLRESTEHGPDFCRTCSEALSDWVAWPCPATEDARAEVVRDVEAAIMSFGYSEPDPSRTAAYRLAGHIRRALNLHHTATAAQEGTTEPLGASGGSAGGSESPRASDGRTGPRLKGYTCGERHGDMRCQLRRGHAGAHEDYSGMVR